MDDQEMRDQEIRHAFHLFLGRWPQDEDLPPFRALNPDQLLATFLRSEEFILKRGSGLQDLFATSAEDLGIFLQFEKFAGPGTPGFVTDFLGTRTDVRFVRGLEPLSGVVEGYPVPRGNFHGDIVEWLGTLLSVLAAEERFTAVELGAGWAPWLAASARATAARGIKHVRLIGVEGSSAHAEMMHRHFENNGIPIAGNLLLHGIVGTRDGTALFPIAPDPSADWGQGPITDATASPKTDYRGHQIAATEEVPMHSLDSLLSGETAVDLVHLDIQGAEADVVEATLPTLRRKVKCLVIGTHGRGIEQRLSEILAGDGWTLCREHGCRLAQEPSGKITCILDGCQMWRNPRLFA